MEADRGGKTAGENGDGGVVEDVVECGERPDRAAAERVILAGDSGDGGVVEDDDIDRRSGEFINKDGEDFPTSNARVGDCVWGAGSRGGEGG